MNETTPDRCACGGPAVCHWCGGIMPNHSTAALLAHVQSLETNLKELLEAAKGVSLFFVYLESLKGEGARGALNLLRKAVRDLEEKAQ